MNDSQPTLRLVVEQPGDEFAADNFDNDGVLYKSLSTGKFQYLGEDPLLYTNAYRQITSEEVAGSGATGWIVEMGDRRQ